MPTPDILISDSELNDLCTYLSQATYIYYPVATDFFRDLFLTGARPAELLQVERWQYVTESNIILTPQKGNYARYFTASQLSPSLLFAIQNGIKPYQGLTLRQLESVLKKILPVVMVGTANKSAIAYMFRYNYAKNLYNDGVSLEGITANLGWSGTALASTYVFASIYSTEDIPEFIFNFITDSNGDIVTDSNGDTLNSEP